MAGCYGHKREGCPAQAEARTEVTEADVNGAEPVQADEVRPAMEPPPKEVAWMDESLTKSLVRGC